MSEIKNNYLEGHYSTETRVKRPKIVAAEAPAILPKQTLFSNKDADKRIQQINTDIYEGAKKEKTKNDFNKKLYFKIFGGVALFSAGIAGVYKIRNFFRKS